MSSDRELIKGGVLFRLTGEYSTALAEYFDKSWEYVLENKASFVALDMRNAELIDSTGIGSLVKLYNRTRQEGIGLYLLSPSVPVLSVLKTARLDGLLEITDADRFIAETK